MKIYLIVYPLKLAQEIILSSQLTLSPDIFQWKKLRMRLQKSPMQDLSDAFRFTIVRPKLWRFRSFPEL